ncbi:MAG: type II toxin-antitoxin system VapC family toxin [Mycobacterium sp.]|uniref:type II toxin-antitoxin system VapC family toxin n=1 Tax=Mycobacterium sp. TaxID=1785 RepID=UPI0026358C00|nr:type II toxin-antitoxin system VapC family toxin [Mycobacterium sp.]MDI3314149.1 type II toxin-antitoxin system VapC family toxin [Mycobacterium sp.]
MIFVDSNIPMYLVGASHPHKLDAQRLLESALSAGERLVTDAVVLHEICHRYVAINRARDALHVAVMVRRDITQLLSFDRGFDAYPGIERLA